MNFPLDTSAAQRMTIYQQFFLTTMRKNLPQAHHGLHLTYGCWLRSAPLPCPQTARTMAAVYYPLLLLPLVPLPESCEPALLEGTSSGRALSSNTLGSPASAPLNTHSGTERPLLFAIDAPTAALATFSPSRNRLAGAATCK